MTLDSGQTAILVGVIVNIIMVAFSYGSLSQKVKTLEIKAEKIEKLTEKLETLTLRIALLEKELNRKSERAV